MPLEGETHFAALKKSFAGAVELQGKTLGVIGFGAIGKEVLQMGIGLGMKVKVLTRKPRTEEVMLEFFDGQEVSFAISSETNMETFLADVDFLSINIPTTDGYLLDDEQFEMMKDGVFIVNTARGGVLNEVSLLNHLESGKIAGAALDVFENEPTPELALLMNPNLSLSPHVGGSTLDAQDKIGRELAEQIIDITNQL